MIKLNSKGDTIIEVLICLAVLGLVIGSAYGITNKSLKGMRMAQERTEALKIAEGQVEQIKHNGAGPAGNCFNDLEGCTFSRYMVNIFPNTPNPNIFTVQVTWERIGGGGQENLKLLYGIY